MAPATTYKPDPHAQGIHEETMASCLPLALVFSFLFVLPLALAIESPPAHVLSYHGGPLLTGQINLSLLWYGQFGRSQKKVIRSFINSLNNNNGAKLEPQVSSWWQMVGSYQSFAGSNSKRSPGTKVKVVRQVTDTSYSLGKVITIDFIKPLVQKVTAGTPNTLAVIFTSREVTASDLCLGKCSDHGVIDDQPYILVGNPETECPGTCGWPFHRSDYGPQGAILQPPNGNVGTDSMVFRFAAGLAGAVTNPFKTGFFEQGRRNELVEAATACPGILGSGAFPGYAGKVMVDAANGGAFNSHGRKGRKFLVPAIWNPSTSSCWTPL